MEYEVKLLGRETIKEQIAIYRESFELEKKEFYEKTEEYWINKHYTNPIHDSYVFGAYDGNQIVGINCFLPIVYECGSEDILAVQSCESGVRISHRRKGIWGQIIRYAMNYFKIEAKYELMIGYPNVNNSYNGFLKLGWRDVLHMDNYMMVGNGAEFAKAVLNTGRRWLPFNILNIQHLKCIFKNKHRTSIETVAKNDVTKNVKNVLHEASDSYALKLSNDLLDWKLRYNGANFVVVAFENGRRVNIIYDIQMYKNANFLRILFFDRNGCNDSEITDAFAAFILWAIKNNRVAFVRVWATAKDIYTPILKRLGFVRANHVNPYIVYALNENKSSEYYNPQKWLPHFIDLD